MQAGYLHEGPEIKTMIANWIFCRTTLRDGDDTITNTNVSGAMHVK